MITSRESVMGQPIVHRPDDRLIQAREQRAARSARSAEAEHRALPGQVLGPETRRFAKAAARLRARTPPQSSDSADLLRMDRDRDGARS
jgi:plasmid stability protein